MERAVKKFEAFCANNGVKPTEMKAEYYLAGFFAGRRDGQEQAWEWLNEACSKHPIMKEELPLLEQSYKRAMNEA